MDKRRLLLAFALMMIVAVAPSLIWPTKKPPARPTAGRPDSLRRADSTQSRPAVTPLPSDRPTVRPSDDTGRIIWVTSPLYRLGFSSKGARLVAAELLQYKSFARGDSGPVQLVPAGDAFLRHRLVLSGGDTVSLEDWSFQPSPDAAEGIAGGHQLHRPGVAAGE